MKNSSNFVWMLVAAAGGLFAAGCTSSRDVEVSGEVSAPATTTVEGPITLDFLDVIGDDEGSKSVHQATLPALGSFQETVELEGHGVRVRAIDDRNGDGTCTDGEAWAEVEATVADDDTVEPVKLELTNAPCALSDDSEG
jgi:hypothetical protein